MDVSNGDRFTLTRLRMSAHTGTHIDAPAHFIKGGGTIDDIDLEALIGPVQVIDLASADGHITRGDLQAAGLPAGTERVLLKTKNSALWKNPVFRNDYVALAADGAQWLVERRMRLVGIDYLSVEAFDSTEFAAHNSLLAAGVVVLEGVNLQEVGSGTYQLVCLPLKIEGAEGAPTRAVLILE